MKLCVALLALIVGTCLFNEYETQFIGRFGRFGFGGLGGFGGFGGLGGLGFGGPGFGLGFGLPGMGLGFGGLGFGGPGFGGPGFGGPGFGGPGFGGQGGPGFGGQGGPGGPPPSQYGGQGSMSFGGQRPHGYQKRETMTDIKNKTECLFFKKDSLLSCKLFNESVECDATHLFDEQTPIKQTFFTIALLESQSKPSDMKFYLFGKNMFNTTWMSDVISSKGTENKLAIFTGDKKGEFGLNLKDSKCFEKIVKLFDSPESSKLAKPINKDKPIVSIVGRINFVDSKRIKSKKTQLKKF